MPGTASKSSDGRAGGEQQLANSNWQLVIGQSQKTAFTAKGAKETGNSHQRLSAQISGKGFCFG
jgi:hypothetical protein